jgi:hypothetical protein
MTRPAPYPSDTRPKGWRFELDYERIEASDTWALAPAEVRPWLLMLWLTAWKQTPCGSLPNDEALIAARIGMPLPAFSATRAVLMRGWWLADDGRLYHDTIAERVRDMLAKREQDRLRKADYRQRTKARAKDVPKASHGTDAGQTWDAHGTPLESGGVLPEGRYQAPGTKHQAPEPESAYGTSAVPTAGEVVKAMRDEGIQKASPSNPHLLELLAAGVPLTVFVEAARIAVKRAEKSPFGWALARIRNRIESGEIDLHAGKPKPVPAWAASAGFPSVFEANNAGCFEHNAHEFRDGDRIAEVTA